MSETKPKFRTGDSVLHKPSGQEWLVAYYENSLVCPCGHPLSFVEEHHFELTEAADDDKHRQLLEHLATSGDMDDPRRLYARRVLNLDVEYYVYSITCSKADEVRGIAIWWRPNDNGYTSKLDRAGRFRHEKIMADPNIYNNGETTFAIPCDVVERMSFRAVDLESIRKLIRTNREVGGA